MCERKQWTKMEDDVLLKLKLDRKIDKWSHISEIMVTEFGIQGRSGKQCRERFHNHLDLQICKRKWTPEEELLLFKLHDEWGNRWASISRQIPGRTDNCVKNHFYSYLRKSMKTINSLIRSFMRKTTREIKSTIVTKIISIIEMYHQNLNSFPGEVFTASKNIKHSIIYFHQNPEEYQEEESVERISKLCQAIADLNKATRNKLKKKKKTEQQADPQERIKIFRKTRKASDKQQDESNYLREDSQPQSDYEGQVKIHESEYNFLPKQIQFKDSEEVVKIQAIEEVPGAEGAFMNNRQNEQEEKQPDSHMSHSANLKVKPNGHQPENEWMSSIFLF